MAFPPIGIGFPGGPPVEAPEDGRSPDAGTSSTPTGESAFKQEPGGLEKEDQESLNFWLDKRKQLLGRLHAIPEMPLKGGRLIERSARRFDRVMGEGEFLERSRTLLQRRLEGELSAVDRIIGGFRSEERQQLIAFDKRAKELQAKEDRQQFVAELRDMKAANHPSMEGWALNEWGVSAYLKGQTDNYREALTKIDPETERLQQVQTTHTLAKMASGFSDTASAEAWINATKKSLTDIELAMVQEIARHIDDPTDPGNPDVGEIEEVPIRIWNGDSYRWRGATSPYRQLRDDFRDLTLDNYYAETGQLPQETTRSGGFDEIVTRRLVFPSVAHLKDNADAREAMISAAITAYEALRGAEGDRRSDWYLLNIIPSHVPLVGSEVARRIRMRMAEGLAVGHATQDENLASALAQIQQARMGMTSGDGKKK